MSNTAIKKYIDNYVRVSALPFASMGYTYEQHGNPLKFEKSYKKSILNSQRRVGHDSADPKFSFTGYEQDIKEFHIYAKAEEKIPGTGIDALNYYRKNRNTNLDILANTLGVIGAILLLVTIVIFPLFIIPILTTGLAVGLGVAAAFAAATFISVGLFTPELSGQIRKPDVTKENLPEFAKYYDEVMKAPSVVTETVSVAINEVHQDLVDLTLPKPGHYLDADGIETRLMYPDLHGGQVQGLSVVGSKSSIYPDLLAILPTTLVTASEQQSILAKVNEVNSVMNKQ